MIIHCSVSPAGQGLHDISAKIDRAVASSGVTQGLCTVFLQHTSASLIIQENADPSARHDLERWLNRLVPEDDALYTHTLEGPDDMPSHIKNILTATSIAVPVSDGRLALGTWQGLYLWEHRSRPATRRLVLHLLDDGPDRASSPRRR